MRIPKLLMISVVTILFFSCPPQTVWSGTTERVSISSDGEEANYESGNAVISADDRFVAFGSWADNLVPGDTNDFSDIFMHDRQTGQTTRVSVNSDGEQANGISGGSSISSDGRLIAYYSGADNLVPGDTNGNRDIFVHDRQTGQTTIVSVNSDGEQANTGSYFPSMSQDGRFVAFDSDADNLVSGDTFNSHDVFVHDRQTDQTTRVSVNSDGEQANGSSGGSSISADGRFVAFGSSAKNLVPGDTNRRRDIFVHDRQTGQTTRVSVSSDGKQANGSSRHPSISSDAHYVIFDSEADNLVPGDTNGKGDVFVHDRQTGRTSMISVNSDGEQGNDDSYANMISPEGRFVAFGSLADNLVSDDTNLRQDIFVHDRYDADLSTNVFSPSFYDISTWAAYKDKDIKNTRVMTFADGGAPGEKYKVVIKTTTGDTINYLFTSKGSGYTGCDKSAYDGQWPGYRKIDLGSNSGFAKLLKMKMIKRSGTGSRNGYVGFFGTGDEGWTQTSGPADGCGWSAVYGSDGAFIRDEKNGMQSLQTDIFDDGETIVFQSENPGSDDTQTWMADISATASGNVFSPRFDDTSTWVVYKDTDNKDTKVITFADAGDPGEKYKVVIKTTTGDTIIYLFTSKGSGYTGCDKSAYDGQWPGYRQIELGSNAGFAKLLKMKMIKRKGTGSRNAYVGFFGSGDEGWTQTSGPADGCGW